MGQQRARSYTFEITTIEISIPDNRIGFVFNGFWRENDVIALKANFHFPVTAQKVHYSECTPKKVDITDERLELKKLKSS